MMTSLVSRKPARTFWAIVVLLPIGGCGTVVDLGETAKNSPTLYYVASNRDQFAQQSVDSLANVDAGTVMDDLADLSGCFGASYEIVVLGVTLRSYEAYSFDPISGEMQYLILQGPALRERQWPFYVAEADRIVIRRTLADGSEVEVEALVTLGNGEMKIAYMTQDGNFLDGSLGDPADERVVLVFKAFDCP